MFIFGFIFRYLFIFSLGVAAPYIAYYKFNLTVPGLGSKTVIAVTSDVASSFEKGNQVFKGLVKKGTTCRKRSVYKNNVYMNCIVKVPENSVGFIK